MENMEVVSTEEARKDQFPVGMRVLAVDDNPTCLRKLEELLLRCKYHVTKTMDSKKALDMLRDKSNMFDLVISDVEMPDVDGFKLLELVGLEMDLPVIMLSAHSDYDHVMKGIRHGACDYLVKPVGLKELRNIWQHVVRKNTNSHAKAIAPSRSLLPQSDSHPSPSVSKKRKGFSQDKVNESGDGDDDDSDGEEEDGEGSEHDDDESCSRKKPRVVWVVELHQKFVAAVQQLGLDKAVPKKILDLMNVEGLTRENVASHLQKYRLYLKKMDESHQHNMATDAFGTRDSSYLQMAQLDGLRDFPSLTATRQLPSSTLLSRSHLSKRNPSLCSPINLQGINSSSFIQQGHYDNTSSNLPNLFGTYNANPFQRTSSPLETIQFPRTKCPPYMGDFKSTPGGNFLDSRMSFDSSSTSSNSLLLQSNYRQALHRGLDGNQSCPPSSSSSPNINGHMLSRFPSHNRSSSDNWQWNLRTTRFPSSSLPLNPAFSQDLVTYGGNAGDCTSLVSAENPGGEIPQCDTQLLGDFIQNMNTLEEQKGTVLNGSFGNVDYPLPLPTDNRITTLNTQQVYMEPDMKSEKPENSALIDNQQDAFDEIMNEMMKQDDNNGMGSIAAARFGFDSFPPPLP